MPRCQCVNDSAFCYEHLPLHLTYDGVVVGECYICSDVVELRQLSCSHGLHMECASMLIEAVCPLCRTPLTENDVSVEVLQSISRRKEEYSREVDATNVEETLNLLRREREASHLPSRETMIARQVLGALTAVRQQHVPLRYLPTEISVTVSRDGPIPPVGNIVMEMLIANFITASIADVGFDEERLLNDDDEDVEDAFTQENTTLAQAQRRLEICFR